MRRLAPLVCFVFLVHSLAAHADWHVASSENFVIADTVPTADTSTTSATEDTAPEPAH